MSLSMTDVSSGYGAAQALFDVSLRVEEGQIVTILGLNGAGKTTTLRTVSGLIPTWAGRVAFYDRELRAHSPEARARMGLAHVPEGRGILTGLTVHENLVLGVARRGDRKRVRTMCEQLLDIFPDLTPRLGEPASALSGGQQQMLALARALMPEPSLVMIDELSFGLSPIMVDHFYQLVSRLRDEGTSFLIVEQNPAILAVADRAYVLTRGRVTFETDTPSLLDAASVQAQYFSGVNPE